MYTSLTRPANSDSRLLMTSLLSPQISRLRAASFRPAAEERA